MDVQAWCSQGFSFAEKLRAAVALETYRITGDLNHKVEAVDLLKSAKTYYQQLVDVTKQHHQPVSMVQLNGNKFHWETFVDQVDRDINVAENYMSNTN